MAETISKYTVRTGTFEGPLDLLLELIESRKLFVNEVSLASVTDEYISFMKRGSGIDLPEATSFLLIASTLILIKSRSLLPNLKLTTEEEGKIVDLEARLRLYAVIKEASIYIKEKFGKEICYMAPERSYEAVFAPDPALTIETIHDAIGEVYARIPKKEVLQEVSVRKVVSIEEMIDGLTERIQSALSLSFSAISKHPNPQDAKDEKVYMIVSFLALLELVREGIVDVLQEGEFKDMTISKQTI